ncbi:MAG: hypothetical protein OJF52_000007 [Nitrospira sp.]|nr:MAG: hypothetical protein OJF52_000007 [Nitrospira sp.]
MGADDKNCEGAASMTSTWIEARQGIQMLTSIVPDRDTSRYG